MKRYVHSSVGSGRKTRYVLIDYPDREPIRNLDTGNRYSFDTREKAEQFIADHSYLKERYPGLSVDSRIEYSVWHA